jgi:hypothetical protein
MRTNISLAETKRLRLIVIITSPDLAFSVQENIDKNTNRSLS